MIGNLYIIRNDVNNKVYIGKTYKTIEQRFKEHINDAKHGSKCKFHRAMRKYGVEHFYTTLIDKFEEGVLEQKEIEYIAKYDSYYHGYNSTLGGDDGKRIQFDEEDVIQKYMELKNIKAVAQLFNVSSCPITTIIKAHNIELFTTTLDFQVVAYDLDYNRVAKLDNRQTVIDFLRKTDYKLNSMWMVYLNLAAENCSTFYGYRWQNQADVIYDGKEFNTVYDKEQYITGKECVEINGLWFAKRRGYIINSNEKICKDENYLFVSQSGILNVINIPEFKKSAKDLSVQELANKYNLSIATARRYINKLCINTNQTREPSKCPPKEELEKVKYLPKVQIAKMYGVSGNAVKKWFVKYGITDGYKNGLDMPLKQELEVKIHMSTAQIAKEYNVSRNTVVCWLKKYNLVLDTQAKLLNKEIPSREELEEFQLEPYRKIAEIYGVDHTTVIRWFRSYNLEHFN